MNVDLKELKLKIQEQLDKLKDIEDEMVKEVYTKLTEYLVDIDKKEVVDEEAEKKAEEEREKKADEEMAEDKEPSEEDVKPFVKESEESKPEATEEVAETSEESTEPTEEVKEEAKELSAHKTKKSTQQLSLEVANKLEQAALELNAKQEAIDVYKNRIVELEAKLKVYTDKEQLELQKQYDTKINTLIELYASVGIQKNKELITSAFTEDQVDKLIIDLSAIVPKKMEVATRPIRKTVVSQELELNNAVNTRPKELNDMERAQLLFNI